MNLSALADELGSDGGAVGRVLHDATGAVVAINSAAERLLGHTLAELQLASGTKPLFAVIDQDGHGVRPTENSAARVLDTGESAPGCVVGVRRPRGTPAGRQVWLDVESNPVRDEDDTLIGVLSAFTAIEGVRASQLQQSESERATRLLIERSSSMVALHLPDTTFIWVSAASRELLGYEPEDLVGTRGLDLIEPADRAGVDVAMERASAGDSQAAVFRVRHADGHWRWVECVGQVMFDRSIEQLQIQTITRDVTERVTAERERDAALSLFRLALANAPIGMAVLGPTVTGFRSTARCAS